MMRRIVLFAALAAGCNEETADEGAEVEPFDAVIRYDGVCLIGQSPDNPVMVYVTAQHIERGQIYESDETPCEDGSVVIDLPVDLTGTYAVDVIGEPNDAQCESEVHVHTAMSLYAVCD